MKFLLTYLFAVIFLMQSFGQSPKNNKILNTELTILKASNDSLKQELSMYKAKEDIYIGLFQTSMSHVDSVFGWLVAIILTGVSLVGFLTFKHFNDQLKDQARYMEKYIKDTDRGTQIMKYELYCYESSSMMGLARVIERLGDRIYSIRMALTAVGGIYKAYKHAPSSNELVVFEKGILEYLKTIEDILPNIDSEKWTEEKIDLLRIAYEEHCYFGDKDIFLSLYEHEDPKIKEASISVFQKLRELTNKNIS